MCNNYSHIVHTFIHSHPR